MAITFNGPGPLAGVRGNMYKTILFSFFLLLSQPLWAGFEIEITPTQMQQMAVQQFPIEKQTLFARVQLSDPQITLPGEQRLALALNINAYFPNNTMSQGSAIVDGKLSYDSALGEFHINHPRLRQLNINGLAKQHNQILKDLITPIIQQSIPSIVIYRLDEKRFRDRLTKQSLKNITIRDGSVYAEMDW